MPASPRAWNSARLSRAELSLQRLSGTGAPRRRRPQVPDQPRRQRRLQLEAERRVRPQHPSEPGPQGLRRRDRASMAGDQQPRVAPRASLAPAAAALDHLHARTGARQLQRSARADDAAADHDHVRCHAQRPRSIRRRLAGVPLLPKTHHPSSSLSAGPFPPMGEGTLHLSLSCVLQRTRRCSELDRLPQAPLARSDRRGAVRRCASARRERARGSGGAVGARPPRVGSQEASASQGRGHRPVRARCLGAQGPRGRALATAVA